VLVRYGLLVLDRLSTERAPIWDSRPSGAVPTSTNMFEYLNISRIGFAAWVRGATGRAVSTVSAICKRRQACGASFSAGLARAGSLIDRQVDPCQAE